MSQYRVLCVDDDAPILRALRSFPWAECYCAWVGEALNGKEALALAEALRPDIALVDVSMPVMDGLAFVREVKKTLPQLQCVIISAYCDFEYARQALRYGVAEYLTKGEYTDGDLAAVLRRLAKVPEENLYRYEVSYALTAIQDRLHEDLTIEGIAREIGISPNYLGLLFAQQTGQRFRDMLSQARMERAKELLQHTPLKIYEVAEQVGIRNPQYFTALFQKHHGINPGMLRR